MTIQQQPNSSSSNALPLLYFPPFYTQEILVTSFYDVMIVCSIILAGKPLHMCTRTCQQLSAYLPASMPINRLYRMEHMYECHHFISVPIFMPVTYIYIEGRWVIPNLSSIEALHTTTLHPYIYIYIYIYIYLGDRSSPVN